MIFSSNKKFIFFAVPKTGTHAVREALRPVLEENDWEQQMLTGRMLSPLPSIASVGHGHISYRQLACAMGEEVLSDMHRFAFVRHPIDRFMSACAFLARTDPSYSRGPAEWAQRAFLHPQFRKRVLIRPQTDMLIDANGRLAMTYIGRYESLQADLNTVLGHIGASTGPLAQRNVTQNPKPRLAGSSGFIDELKDYYEADFRLLGYDPD
jgi:hypothetical protein